MRFRLNRTASFRWIGGYLDFKWLYSLTLKGVWFVARAKKNFKYELVPDSIKSPKEEAFFGVILCVW